MQKTKRVYSNYEQINLDLEILRTERDLAYHQIIQSAEKSKTDIKNSFAPLNVLKFGINTFKSNKKKGIKGILITIIIQYILNKLKK